MSKSLSFPHEIKFGGAIVRILRDPLVVSPVEPSAIPEAAKGKRKKKANKAEKTYDSFLVEYYVGTKRKRIRRSTYAKALAAANEVGVQILNNDVESLQISGKDRRVYLAALDNLKTIEKPLDHVTKEYADAIQMLPTGLSLMAAVAQYSEAIARANGTPLSSILEFYERHGMDIKAKRTVPEVVTELLVSVKADGAGGYHLRDLKRRLGRFAERFSGNILDVAHAEILQWLQGLCKLPGKRKQVDAAPVPVEPKTRNNYRNAVVQLFNFARQQGYLPRDRTTAADDLKAAKEVRGDNEIFTPDQIEKLLINAPPHLVPGMAVKAFSGVRTEEIVKIDWSHFHFEQDYIKLPAKITKLGQRRLIRIQPNLKAWLEPYRQSQGRLCNQWTKPQSVFQAWSRYAARVEIGFTVGENKFRNSFISYRLAQTNDIGLVSLESGNSPATIQRDYLEITTPQEAAKWFGIFPKNPATAPSNGNVPQQSEDGQRA